MFPEKNSTLKKKRTLAALNKEHCEQHPWKNMAQNTIVPRSQEDYIRQISEEIEGRVTEKLSQEFIWTENSILSTLFHVDNFIMIPLIRGHSGTAPEISRNTLGTNPGNE